MPCWLLRCTYLTSTSSSKRVGEPDYVLRSTPLLNPEHCNTYLTSSACSAVQCSACTVHCTSTFPHSTVLTNTALLDPEQCSTYLRSTPLHYKSDKCSTIQEISPQALHCWILNNVAPIWQPDNALPLKSTHNKIIIIIIIRIIRMIISSSMTIRSSES